MYHSEILNCGPTYMEALSAFSKLKLANPKWRATCVSVTWRTALPNYEAANSYIFEQNRAIDFAGIVKFVQDDGSHAWLVGGWIPHPTWDEF